MTFLFIFFFAQ